MISKDANLSRGRRCVVRAVQDADGLAVAVPQGRQLRRAVPAPITDRLISCACECWPSGRASDVRARWTSTVALLTQQVGGSSTLITQHVETGDPLSTCECLERKTGTARAQVEHARCNLLNSLEVNKPSFALKLYL